MLHRVSQSVVTDIPKDQSGFIFALNALALKMKALGSFEISVTADQFTWHDIPEDFVLQQLNCEILKAGNIFF
jgi:hypothetical protein